MSAVGAELGQLMGGTLLLHEADLETLPELEEAVFASYLTGLDEGGWRGDRQLVRLGYTTDCRGVDRLPDNPPYLANQEPYP